VPPTTLRKTGCAVNNTTEDSQCRQQQQRGLAVPSATLQRTGCAFSNTTEDWRCRQQHYRGLAVSSATLQRTGNAVSNTTEDWQCRQQHYRGLAVTSATLQRTGCAVSNTTEDWQCQKLTTDGGTRGNASKQFPCVQLGQKWANKILNFPWKFMASSIILWGKIPRSWILWTSGVNFFRSKFNNVHFPCNYNIYNIYICCTEFCLLIIAKTCFGLTSCSSYEWMNEWMNE